jgi:ribosome-associated protein
VKLSALPDQEIKELELPDSLFVALRALRRLPSHGAQVRQRQYIGKLMREIDPEPVLAKLAERKQRHDLEIRQFQQIERWRDRLLSEPDGAIDDLMRTIRTPTRTRFAALDKAARERIEQRSPVGARELFAYLRQLLWA